MNKIEKKYNWLLANNQISIFHKKANRTTMEGFKPAGKPGVRASSKPSMMVRPSSNSRPTSGMVLASRARDPRSSHYQGNLASEKYNIEAPVRKAQLPAALVSKYEYDIRQARPGGIAWSGNEWCND